MRNGIISNTSGIAVWASNGVKAKLKDYDSPDCGGGSRKVQSAGKTTQFFNALILGTLYSLRLVDKTDSECRFPVQK